MPQKKFETAMFGAGCFWHVEESFRTVNGVIETTVGYAGGDLKNPTYEEVCTDTTGHTEVVHIRFDPVTISYEKLLEIFWGCHDPTTLNRQGPDVGKQYRSVIFFYSKKQEKSANESKVILNKEKYGGRIVTAILPAPPFYRAEQYHQKYLMKRGLRVCPI